MIDFQVGTCRMPMSQPGQQNPVKTPTYSQDEIDALAAYVASLAPGPAVPEEARSITMALGNCKGCAAVLVGCRVTRKEVP